MRLVKRNNTGPDLFTYAIDLSFREWSNSDQYRRWLGKIISSDQWMYAGGIERFYFKNEKDAMLFLLRWS